MVPGLHHTQRRVLPSAAEGCMLLGMQKSLESISEQLRIPGSKSLGPIGQVGHASASKHMQASILSRRMPEHEVQLRL